MVLVSNEQCCHQRPPEKARCAKKGQKKAKIKIITSKKGQTIFHFIYTLILNFSGAQLSKN